MQLLLDTGQLTAERLRHVADPLDDLLLWSLESGAPEGAP